MSQNNSIMCEIEPKFAKDFFAEMKEELTRLRTAKEIRRTGIPMERM
jgi:hypothetical protein